MVLFAAADIYKIFFLVGFFRKGGGVVFLLSLIQYLMLCVCLMLCYCYFKLIEHYGVLPCVGLLGIFQGKRRESHCACPP